MSRTDKDRPPPVQLADPLNRRFQKVGHMDTWTSRWMGRYTEWTWKKLAPAKQCGCCSYRAFLPEKRRRRSGWRKEVERVLIDLAQVAETKAYWEKQAADLNLFLERIGEPQVSGEALECHYEYERYNGFSDMCLGTVDFNGCYTVEG